MKSSQRLTLAFSFLIIFGAIEMFMVNNERLSEILLFIIGVICICIANKETNAFIVRIFKRKK